MTKPQHTQNFRCLVPSSFVNKSTIDSILWHLNKQGYIRVDAQYGELSHCFVVCDTKKGQVMIDANDIDNEICHMPYISAYVDLGEMLSRLMREPSIETWNDVFDLEASDDIEGQFSLSYSYYFS